MSPSKGFTVLAAVAVLGVLSPAHAADLVVDARGGEDYPTIRAAVDDLPAAGPPRIVAGCTFADCGEAAHPLAPIFHFEGDPRPGALPAIGFDERP